jgi:predicted dienelactone hydrolase
MGIASWAADETPPAPARAATEPATDRKAPGPFAVETAVYDWVDAARDRQVPVKIYYPKTGDGPFPVIIFSHGLGGTREGYEYLGRHWASYGYVCVHVQHKGSDDAAWKGAENPMQSMRRASVNPANVVNRPLDVRFAISQMERLNREESPFKGRLDLERVGMAGHSFGAYTTLAVIGEVFISKRGIPVSLPDPRVRAAIAMSAPVPARTDDFDETFGSIKVPCLHMTGTADDSPLSDTKAADRRIPFDHIKIADQYLVTFKGGDHMIFPGRLRPAGDGVKTAGGFDLLPGMNGNPEKDALFHEFILMSTTAFWDAYLKGDAAAKAWLAGGGFEAALGQDGTFEKKPAPENKPPASAPGR